MLEAARPPAKNRILAALPPEEYERIAGTRAGVTEAAHILQSAGLIHYKRGHIAIIDKAALEHFACECYSIVKREFNSLLDA